MIPMSCTSSNAVCRALFRSRARRVSDLLFVGLVLGGLVASQASEAYAVSPKPVTFRSSGTIKALMFNIRRDRSITLTPVVQDGKLVQIKTHIIDHAENNEVITGMMDVIEDGRAVSSDPKIVNACALLGLTPAIIKTLESGKGEVVVFGASEVSGNILKTRIVHSVVGRDSNSGALRIKSHARDKDGDFDMITVTQLGKDGLPWEARVHGTIKKGFMNLETQLKMVRVPTPDSLIAMGE